MTLNTLVEIFPWNEHFDTGILEIDDQHRQLVQLLNNLAYHVATQTDLPSLNQIIDELTNYTLYHFRTEETIWHRYLAGDDWESEHRRSHRQFVDEISKLRSERDTLSTENLLEEILSFLTHWLAFHILESDKRLAEVTKALHSGLSLEQAKIEANQEMSGALHVLIETILSMYDVLSARTLQLTREMVERQKAEASLRMAASVVKNTLEAICIADKERKLIDVNPAFCRLVEREHDVIIGANLETLNSGLSDEKLAKSIWDDVASKGHWRGEIWNRRKNGELRVEWLTLSAVKDTAKGITNYIGIFSSASHLLEQQQYLRRIAHHDALTGLPNRLLFSDRLTQAIAHNQRNQTFLAVCYLDLDGFKQVNDNYGHAAGDQLLKEIAERMKNTVRHEDTVARLGGDEFALVLVNLKTPEDYRNSVERIIDTVAEPVHIDGNALNVTASIGVTVYPLDETGPDELLQHADEAMYIAKQQGKSRYKLYYPLQPRISA